MWVRRTPADYSVHSSGNELELSQYDVGGLVTRHIYSEIFPFMLLPCDICT